MTSFAPLFSNHDYYKDLHFQRCMRNWNKYLASDEEDDDTLATWEELLLGDFREHANESLKKLDELWWGDLT